MLRIRGTGTPFSVLDRAARNDVLPAELYDLIIDGLSDDPLALAAAGLACCAMAPRTRHHLFRSVVLRTGVDCVRLCSILERPGQTTSWVPSFVRSVRMTWKLWVDVEVFPSSYRVALFRVLQLLNKVECLSISGIYRSSVMWRLYQGLDAFSCASLRILKLENMDVYTQDLLRIFSTHPNISAVHTTSVFMWPGASRRKTSVVDAFPNGRISVTELVLKDTAMCSSAVSALCAVTLLRTMPMSLSLQSLEWAILLNAETSRDFRELLRCAGPSLRRLRLEFTNISIPEPGSLDLSRNSNLLSLRITFWSVLCSPLRAQIPGLISSITARSLREVVLEIPPCDKLGLTPYGRLDGALASLCTQHPRLAVAIRTSTSGGSALPNVGLYFPRVASTQIPSGCEGVSDDAA